MFEEVSQQDFRAFWPEFEAIIKARETYAFDSDMDAADAYRLWCETPLKTFAYKDNGAILGSYYLKPNAMGPGDHVCNCGYMVTAAARGKGIARKMCEHSQNVALELGFKAMQFNCVVSTNKVAVNLWQKLGFDIVGTLPLAYRHGKYGFVDCYVMYKWLEKTT